MACDSRVMKKPLINAEYERKKELERRRKLRLLQVRQQSKDFSDKLRETVQAEAIKKRDVALKYKIQEIRSKKVEDLHHLKDMYGECLENIGSSHREAAKQPDTNLIRELDTDKKSKEAAIRGCKARKQQLEEKNLHYQEMHAPLERKRETRNRENMRSFFVSCLPIQSTDHKKSTRASKKELPINLVPDEKLGVLTEVPSNLSIPQSRPSCLRDNKDTTLSEPSKAPFEEVLAHSSKENCIKVRQSISKLHEDYASIVKPQKECSCDYLVCACHLNEKQTRRRCSSESVISSSHISEPKKPKLRSRSCSPQTVRTLNYCSVGNVYESKEQNFAKVKHHQKNSQEKLEGSNQDNTDGLTSKNNDKNEELHKKTEERCLKALQREQLKKDFFQLLKDLRTVNREKLVERNRSKTKAKVYQRERDILSKHESKQKRLDDAFETLLQTVNHSHKPKKGLITNVCEISSDSSPPTLNLGVYHQINPESLARPRRVASTEEETSTPLVTRSLSPKMAGHGYDITSQCPDEELYARGKKYYEGPQYPAKPQHSPRSVKTDDRDYLYLLPHSQESGRDKPLKRSHPSPDSDTSYFSLPEHLTPSQERLLGELLSQVKKKGLKPNLKLYIERLLNMSRESIENLPISPQIDRVRSPKSPKSAKSVNVDITQVADLLNEYADRLNDLVNTFEVMENCASPMQHMTLPEQIRLDPPRHLPSPDPTSQLEQKQLPPITYYNPPSVKVVDQSTVSDTSEISTLPPYQGDSSLSPIHSPTIKPCSEPSPLRQLACKTGNIQTPFGLSSNLLPNPKDLFRKIPSPQPQVEQTSPRSNSLDDSTEWAFAGLPPPPTQPLGAPPIDENALLMEKLGHLPGEGCNQLDLANLSSEMEKLGIKLDKTRALNDEEKYKNNIGVSPQQFDNLDETIQGNAPHLKCLQNQLRTKCLPQS